MVAKDKKFERGLFVIIILATIAFLIAIGFFLFQSHVATETVNRPAQKLSYVDNKTCLQCHQAEAKAWQASHHAWAMAHANAASVIGNFNATSFKQNHLNAHFYKRNNKYYVNTEGPDGKYTDYEIKYTLGVYPLQQYLIELHQDHLQDFTIAWNAKDKNWFHLYPHESAPAGDVLHWTGSYQNANMMCVSCHTTNYQKHYTAENNTYHSTWTDVNVGCQACHGPGENHVAWARAQAQGKSWRDAPGEHLGLTVNFKTTNKDVIIETCAMCHSRRSELTAHAQAGDAFLDNYMPALLTDGLYYSDGQQQGEVYVYSSFLQSKMYRMGVTCIDCHNPHTGKLKAEGNAVCTQCHSPQGDKRFPSAAKLYDDPTHTFHKMGTPGAQCVSCHMPSKNYMIIHSRPDHSIRIPRPDLSMKLDTPNACTNCHTDKSAQWANDWINKWYKTKPQASLHYGEIFSAGRIGKPGSETALMQLAQDESQSAIVRATALDLLARYGTESIPTAIAATKNSNALIRRAAVTSLEKLPATERLASVGSLLSDPIRAVRIEAARVLSSVPNNLLNEKQAQNLNLALEEYSNAQRIHLDMPGNNLNLAVLYENQHDAMQAEKYYLNALRIDPDFTPARLNLARLYSSIKRSDEAEKILSEGVKRLPTQGDLHYSLGLLLAEENQLAAAAQALEHAAKLLPDRARVQYNYALALQQLGKRKPAEKQFLVALQLQPDNSTYLSALAIFYAQNQEWQKALPWARKLAQLNPQDSEIQQFLERIESANIKE